MMKSCRTRFIVLDVDLMITGVPRAMYTRRKTHPFSLDVLYVACIMLLQIASITPPNLTIHQQKTNPLHQEAACNQHYVACAML